MSRTMKRLAAGDEEARRSQIPRLIDQPEDLVGRHLARRHVAAAGDVAVGAAQVAVVGDEQVDVGKLPERHGGGAPAVGWRQAWRLLHVVDRLERLEEGDYISDRRGERHAVALRQPRGKLTRRVLAGAA